MPKLTKRVVDAIRPNPEGKEFSFGTLATVHLRASVYA